MVKSSTHRIGARIKSRRESLGLTQGDLAGRMGLNHRQTLSTIESGERSIRPGELVAAARALEVSPDYFTDPYAAAGEAAFSFRAESAGETQLSEVEELAGGWLATYRELASPSLIRHALSLTAQSSFESAQEAGEQTRRDLGLGRAPAFELEAAIEREWEILVLYADLPDGVSGAASRLGVVQAVLINRREPRSRRHYDLAHELFHLLTWDSMPPARVELGNAVGGKAKRIEQLANNFAAALLMPADSMRDAWTQLESLPLAERIGGLAESFGVSGAALKWRLLNLDLVERSRLPEDAEIARSSVVDGGTETRPLLFNAGFVHRVHRAVVDGTLSLRKAARIVGTDAAGLSELCRSYGRTLSYEV